MPSRSPRSSRGPKRSSRGPSRVHFGSKTPRIPKVITHANMGPLLNAISAEAYFQPGPQRAVRPKWVDTPVVLEVPTGELARDGLITLALVGRRRGSDIETTGLTGREGFAAQGLEGKVRIRKPLFNALMNLRDLIPVHRGRIVVE